MNIKGKRVAVLGAGRSGRAAAKLALEQGGMVTLYDAAAAPAGFENLAEGITCHPLATEQTGRECEAEGCADLHAQSLAPGWNPLTITSLGS